MARDMLSGHEESLLELEMGGMTLISLSETASHAGITTTTGINNAIVMATGNAAKMATMVVTMGTKAKPIMLAEPTTTAIDVGLAAREMDP